MAAPIIRIKRSSVPGKKPTVEQLPLGELALNTYDAEVFVRRERTGIGTDIVSLSAGSAVTNILYVTADGNDNNTGRKLGDAKATIAAAVGAATSGTIIRVAPGSYVENNPIIIPDGVSIRGEDQREVSITPQNTGDLFYIGNGSKVSNVSFVGSANTGAIFSFNPNAPSYINQSPYIKDCTNFIPNSIGLKVDGSNAIGPLKSMVLDSYTQYNQGGIGASITNEAYAQLVSMFTICNDTAVFCGSGGACDLTNSNSSFGTYALVSDGVGPLKYSGLIAETAPINSDTFTLDLSTPTYYVEDATYDNVSGIATITLNSNHNFNVGMGISIADLQFSCAGSGSSTYPSGDKGYVFEIKSIPSSDSFSINVGVSTVPNQVYEGGGTAKINVVRPFDGQVVYFDELYYTVGNISVGSGGTGYINTPEVTISPPDTEWGVQAQAVAEVKNGSVVSLEIISSGRGYTSMPTITISNPDVGINTASATVQLVPSYYIISSSTPIESDLCTITLTDTVPYEVGIGTYVPFYKQSRLLASGHSLEYIGSGNTISTALPSAGGVAIQENEVVMKDGGLVVYTSTDQSGNFRIGDGVVINQQTGTISGTFYSKSLFSTVTPFILALGGE